MVDEIAERQEKARSFMQRNNYSGLLMATPQNIQYFTGITEPSIHTCSVVIMGQASEVILAVLWVDKEMALEQAINVSVRAYAATSLGKIVLNMLDKLNGAKGTVAMDIQAFTLLGGSFRRNLPNAKIKNTTFAIEEQIRSVKSESEINNMQKACSIADTGMTAVADALRPGMTELEVAAVAESTMVSYGSDAIKHPIYVGSGKRARLLHAVATQKEIASGELVSVDLGAVFNGYTSDLARTFLLGKPSDELHRAFHTLKEAQDIAIDRIHPGITINKIQDIAQEYAYTAGFPMVGHMGHNVGLGVEERPFLMKVAQANPAVKIQENNVIAFFQGSVRHSQAVNLGIRLEDTLVITESGAQLLTTYPRELVSV